MTSKECGEFITVLRKEQGLTQKQLAEKLNISDKAVSRWETGKGYPDVTSLMALSELFGISVNELLAGKRFQPDNIKEIADENIISVFKEAKKNKKKQAVQIIVYTSVLLIILIPTLYSIINELLPIIFTQLKTENIKVAVVMTVIAFWLLLSGCSIRKGNLSLLHSYHYKNVTDTDGYAKEMGNATICMSIPTFIDSFLSLFAHIKVIEIIGSVLLIVGMIICLVYIFKIQTKYNGGLF
ncbi:MAG: helix-turn-helix domain-containing protein [Clostridia bacterium]|nr:helix-turn-helix domain-containing protein [Clostridia bacterium]